METDWAQPEQLTYHIRWQVAMLEWNGPEWWLDLPDLLTLMLEIALKHRLWPLRFPMDSEYEYTIVPAPVMVNLVTGEVMRLQRIAIVDM